MSDGLFARRCGQAGLLAALAYLAVAGSGCRTSQATAAGPLPPLRAESLPPYYARDIQRSYRELQSRPGDTAVTERLASVFYYVKDAPQAEAWFERLCRMDSRSSRAYFELGSAQLLGNHRSKAAASFDRAVSLDRRNDSASLRLGMTLLDLGDLERSRRLFTDLIRRNPKDHNAYFGVGRVFASQGELVQAAANYQKAVQLFPDFKECRQALAHVLLRLSRHEEAQQQLADAEKANASSQPWVDPIFASVDKRLPPVGEWVRRGGDKAAAGDFLGALQANLTALEINPALYQAQANLIGLYASLREPEKSEAAFHATVASIMDSEADPNRPSCANNLPARMADAYANFGTALIRGGRLEEARRIFQEGLKVAPNNSDLNNGMGSIAEWQGRMAEAEARYRAAIRAKPDFAPAHFNLGRLLAARRNYGPATNELLAAVSLEGPAQGAMLDQSIEIFNKANQQEEMLRFVRVARARFEQSKQKEMGARLDHFTRILGILGAL